MMDGKEQDGAKFRDYFEHTEALAGVPSHQALAMFRGRNEGVLALSLVLDPEENPPMHIPAEAMVAQHWHIENRQRPADQWLRETVRWTWRVKLLTTAGLTCWGSSENRRSRKLLRYSPTT